LRQSKGFLVNALTTECCIAMNQDWKHL
jgi:hypothetical protein